MVRALLLAVALLAPLERLDLDLQRAVQAMRAPWLEPAMRGASDVARPVTVLAGLLGVALFDAASGPATARLALLALATTNLIVEGLKRGVNRTRPDGERKRSNASFPSSHAANAAAIAWIFARRWRRLAPAFWTFALVVAASRVYLNRHYASDVVAGLAIGAACAWLAPRLGRRLGRLRPAVPDAAPPPD